MPSVPFRSRHLRATAVTLSWQGVDQYGEPADPGTVTVRVVGSDGTTIKAAGTATSGSSTSPRTVALTATQTAQVDTLTATWTVSGVDVATTEHDIVGGFLFSVADGRGVEKSTADQARDPADAAMAARDYVEWFIEDVCQQAFVPRFHVQRDWRHTASYRHQLSYPNLRAVRWAKEWAAGTATSLTSGQCSEIPANRLGFAERPSTWWNACVEVEVGYEHGMVAPPADLRREAQKLWRVVLNEARTAIPDRASSYTDPSGAIFQLARVGTERRPTGIDSVDEALRRYDATVPGFG